MVIFWPDASLAAPARATLFLCCCAFLQNTKGLPRVDFSNTANTINSTNLFPYFDLNVERNVTTAVGQTAFLHCRVEHLGDKSVSWIRKRDLHILTAGVLTYTTDQRFLVIRPDKSENWTLSIKFPQLRDSGIYECQVSTEPKMSLAFSLNVIESKAKILGPSEVYIKSGSELTLTCVISQGPHNLGTIFWYRGERLVHDDGQRRLTIDTRWTDGFTSELHISRALGSDTGNYTCRPTSAEATSVNVHVINDEHPAAMQHGNRSAGSTNLSLQCLLYSIAVIMTNKLVNR
ncbi:zwei Ig domain protein zig-8 [Bemisia tabaci]|uniref:zwei Ig domain protein zig-8 n=1 Tax=Bemisia tabaci TaxID=7038 RepID=UPI0008F9E378|nr:PREDICTED: protein borderless-like [Bemisia tabaci]